MGIPKIFRLNMKTFAIVSVFVTLIVLAFILPQCHAAEAPFKAPYVQFSVGSAVVRGPTPVLDMTYTFPAPQLRNAYWQYSLTLIGESSFRNQSAPNNMVIRALFVDGLGQFDFGIGPSWMMNPLPYNGSNVNFNLQLAYRFKSKPVTLTYSHFSNAGQTETNLGRDLLLIGWRFH
jgi:hypothetical protein